MGEPLDCRNGLVTSAWDRNRELPGEVAGRMVVRLPGRIQWDECLHDRLGAGPGLAAVRCRWLVSGCGGSGAGGRAVRDRETAGRGAYERSRVGALGSRA